MTGKELGEKMLGAVKSAIDRAASALRKEWDERFSAMEKRLQEIPAGPKGEDGRDGVDGKSVLLEDVQPVIVYEIKKRVAEIPVPKDGIDGKNADAELVESVVSEVLPAMVGGVQKSLEERIDNRITSIPIPKDGKDGRDGKDSDEESLRAFITEEIKKAVAEIPAPKDGESGKDGRDGKDADEAAILRAVREEVKAAVSVIPIPKDGVPGSDGQDGLDALEIEPIIGIDETKKYMRGTWAVHKGGMFRAYQTTDGMSGWECMFKGVHEEQEEVLNEGRTIRRTTVYSNGEKFVRDIKTSSMIYREIWRDGEYEKGDVVTYGGSAWHCQDTTKDKPGTSKSWKLMVKEGRPGKDSGESTKFTGPVRLK